ncbi:MAG: MFS transporter [Dehalococcoidia bacterium]|nr:MFS transporter [Dehalococcoidia bacterium]
MSTDEPAKHPQTEDADPRIHRSPVYRSSQAADRDADTDARRGTRFRTFTALQYLNFRYFWLGNLGSSAAQWVQQVTISWLVYDLTGSAVMLGLVNGMSALPFALTAPFAGVMADRMDRRRLMMATAIFTAVASLLFGLDVLLGYVEVWHVFAFTFIAGSGRGIHMTVRQAVTATLVPRRDLVNAVALGSVSFNITRVIGPGIGGYLIAIIGTAGNFFVQAGCYFATFVTIIPLKLRQEGEADKKSRPSFFRQMTDGFRYVVDNGPVRSLLILGLVPLFFIFPINALMPIFAKDIFKMGPSGFGIMFTAIGAGSLIGTLVLASMGDIRHKALVFYVALTVAIGMLIVFAWTRSLPLALLVLAIQGAFQMVYFSLNNATLQLITPDNMRGRVMSLNMLDTAMIPLGGFAGGMLAEAFGAPMALTVLGATGLCFVVVAFSLLPAVRKL